MILTLPPRPVPYAVLGSPVGHSLSPVMQQAAFDHEGIEARYFRIEVDEAGLARAVQRMREVPCGGWNCTLPNKVRMLELCDPRAESAENLRAVNTVVNERGTLVGHNTDGIGFSRALREAFGRGPEELRILLLGAGGAGRGIATQALLEKSPRLMIANRNEARAQELAQELRDRFGARTEADLGAVAWNDAALAEALRESDLVVNATSAGLDPKAGPVLPARLLRPELLVFDTVYGAGAAKLRGEAESAGALWCDGLGMLLHQGAAAFTLWTGRPAPRERMREALSAAFSASRR
jgi:shikimate dehydrogenase